MEKIFKTLLVTKNQEQYETSIVNKNIDELPQEEVLIKVAYSSLNFKDALSTSGLRGISKNYPHTPGVDAAGTVDASTNPLFQIGDKVIVNGFDLGVNSAGGFSEYIRVPAKWIVKLPEGMTLRESMCYGTAGFTAGMSIEALLKNGITPEKGTIVVTGATGGVGSLAIGILHKLGYSIAAVSGKASANDFLKNLGATEIIPREEMNDQSNAPMLTSRFAGAIDSVGGNTLSTLLKSLEYGGVVAACGMVGGTQFNGEIAPFIIRGNQLIGINSVLHPIEKRDNIWEHLATDWKPKNLENQIQEISLEQIPEYVGKILKGEMQGRAIVKLEM